MLYSLYCSRAFPVEAKQQDLKPELLLLLLLLSLPLFPQETWPPLPTPAPQPVPGMVSGPHASIQRSVCFSRRKVSLSNPLLPVNPLSYLRNQPQFQVMRQLIQQNAALLPALLQEIGRENPELLQVRGCLLGFFFYFYILNSTHRELFPRHSDPSSLRCHCATAGDPNQPGGFHSDAERTQSGGGAWRWGGGRWRDSGRHEQHQSHEIHPGHAAGERGHREGEDGTTVSVRSSEQHV